MRLLRRDGLPEAVILIAVAALVAAVFAFTPLDMAVARVFFRPDAADHWALAQQWPASSLSHLGPLITLLLFVLGFLALMMGSVRRDRFWRGERHFSVARRAARARADGRRCLERSLGCTCSTRPG
jgi:hypothetical protein